MSGSSDSRLRLPERPAGELPDEIGSRALQLIIAVMVPVGVALDLSVGHYVTTAMLATFLTLPIWLPSFIRVPAGALVMFGWFGFLVSGFLLDWVVVADHVVERRSAFVIALTFSMNFASVGALYWSSRKIGINWVIAIYAGVWLLDTLSQPSSWADNPWKYGFVMPVSLLVFSTIDRQRSTTLKILAVLILAAVSATNDSRSVMAVFLLTAVALAWQRIRLREVRDPSLAMFLSGAVAIAFGAYYLLTRLLVSGALGAGLKERSERQVEASGSLLLGGRPEWTVTMRLFRERPWGFGIGATPSQADYELGREGFASIHLSSQENYLKNYVFDKVFSLHSILADMWSAAGLFGVLVVLTIAWLLLSSMASELAHRTCGATQIFVTALALWNLGFSPYYSNLPEVMLAVAVAISMGVRSSENAHAHPEVGGPPVDDEYVGARGSDLMLLSRQRRSEEGAPTPASSGS